MSAGNFDNCLPIILQFEGGRSNDSRDPSGRTNKGITQRTYNAYRAAKGLPQADVYKIASAEVADCYRRDYWNAVKGDVLRPGEDLVVFDFAVNSGPARALRTWNAEGGGAVAQAEIVRRVCFNRLAFMKSLSIWPHFRVGWSKRVAKVQQYGLEMVEGKAPPTKIKVKPIPAGGGVIVAGGAAATGAWQWLDNLWAVAGFVGIAIVGALYVWSVIKKTEKMTSTKTHEPSQPDPAEALEIALAKVLAAKGALTVAVAEALEARDAVVKRDAALQASVAAAEASFMANWNRDTSGAAAGSSP